jgi:hypothetical protein
MEETPTIVAMIVLRPNIVFLLRFVAACNTACCTHAELH